MGKNQDVLANDRLSHMSIPLAVFTSPVSYKHKAPERSKKTKCFKKLAPYDRMIMHIYL